MDPAERFKTEFQKAYTDKNLKRLLQKTNASDQIDLSDQLAVRDKDYMDYTAMLNAHESAPVRGFVDHTISLKPNAQNSLRTPAPVSTKFNNLYQDTPDTTAQSENHTGTHSPFKDGTSSYNFKA